MRTLFPSSGHRRTPSLVVFIPWLIVAFSLLRLKQDLLVVGSISATVTGLHASFSLASLAYNLACFRADVPLLFLLIPLVLGLSFYLAPRSWRLAMTVVLAGVCVLLEVAIYVQERAFQLTGQLVSSSLVMSAISWARNDSGAKDYLTLSGLIKFGILVFAIVVSAVVAHRADSVNPEQRHRFRRAIVLSYLAVALLVTAVCWIVRTPATPFTTNIATILVKSSFDRDQDTDLSKGLEAHSMQQLIGEYRQLTHAPVSDKDPAYWGKAKNANIVYVILETAPARDLDLGGDLSQYPNFARLREHSLVGLQHHSTYPYTNRAYMSIFTSLYPFAMSNFRSFPDRTLPGTISTLRSEGYETGIYGPLWTGEDDQNMLKSIGFDTLGVPSNGINDAKQEWREKIQVDLNALHMLESDIGRWNNAGKRFVVAFDPQIGHGPWPDMSNDGGQETVAERGQALMRLEDSWVGQLLQFLDQNHLTSNTIIVVTGDHGIRYKPEDPAFEAGWIDDYSFHVPLLIYCPAAFPGRLDLSRVTSHIDIGPTLLDLLGINHWRTMEEGAPMWQQNLDGRTTFFLASYLFGADGYYENPNYYMVKYLSNTAYESSRLHFYGNPPLPAKEVDAVKAKADELNAIEAAIFLKLSIGASDGVVAEPNKHPH